MYAKRLSVIGLGFFLVIALVIITSASILAAPESAPTNETAQIASSALAAQITPGPKIFNLCATTGTVGMPDGTTHDIWGFSNCTDPVSVPGPELRAVDGDSVTINLTNNLADPVSILVPGQDVAASGGAAGAFTREAPAGGTVTYTFTAREGSYLYESGTNADIQVAMGLYGALIVESATAGQANGNTFDQEAVLVLSEIDPNLNADPAGFNMQDYHPTYWLINGAAYPDTSPLLSADAGEKVLLRYLNAGYQNLSMAILGGRQTLIAKEGYATPAAVDLVAEIVAAGQTMDTTVDTTGLSGSLALYNRNMYVSNGAPGAGHYPGGMLTFLDVQGAVGNAPTVSFANPMMDGDTVAGSITVQINAGDTDGTITGVEWRVIGSASGWQPAALNGSFYEDSWDTTQEPEGPVTLEARATDNDGNTTTTSRDVVVDNIDEAPLVSIFDPMDGDLVTGSITIQATASDDHNVAQVEFFDGAVSLGVGSVAGDVWSVTWNTSGDGLHTLEARATDDGIPANESSDFIDVTVDNTKPTVSITAPANGDTVSGMVTIEANATDATSGVSQVEFFVDDGTSTNSIAVDTNGGDGWSADWDTGDLNAGGYSLTATATDGVGLTESDTIGVTVDNPPLSTLHVGDLNAVTVLANAGQPNERWTATVTVSVDDATEAPVSGAEVFFEVAWINKNNGNTQSTSMSCTTVGSGQCQVGRQFQSNNTEDIVTFTVTDISHASLTYEPLDNHDPDPNPGEDVRNNMYSDGTTIEVEVMRP